MSLRSPFLRLLLPLLMLLAGLHAGAAMAAVPVSAVGVGQEALGLYAAYLQESGERLSVAQAAAALDNGEFRDGGREILNFGIGARPAWVHLRVENPLDRVLPRQLSVETAWLDRLEIYVRHAGRMTQVWTAGDLQPFARRPVESRHFVFPLELAPGYSDVFIRVETPDPMVLPIHLLPAEEAHLRETRQGYGYGFIYGFLFALLSSYAILGVGLRKPRYVLYAVYLGMFVVMNVSYTGHGFQWLWPDSPAWAQWSNPVLILLYAVSGLAFALHFLDVRRYFPRLRKAVLAYVALASGLFVLALLSGQRDLALLVSFTFVTLFTWIMLGIGLISLRTGQRPARYFLLAAIAGMLGASITALSVWGFLPYSVWSFRAVEMGMLVDATLLALALVYQLRVGQDERARAVRLAQLDPLTGLNNRRAFYDKAQAIWNMMLRHDRNLSVILLDIDHFKRINDTHGHALGDEVLVETAKLLMRSIRQEDVVARWGGEEFLILLPETGLKEAVALAERLRAEMAAICMRHTTGEVRFTASFGVARRDAQHATIELLISAADKYLYRSKNQGRNQVSFPPVALVA